MSEQNYEQYWSVTNAFTDYNSDKFLRTLEITATFIQEFEKEPYSQEKYERLQARVNFDNINDISVRKRINQLVKLGFINPRLLSIHPDSLLFLDAKTNRKRSSLLSKIVYSNSKLNASVKEDSSLHQINFLLKTLEEVGKLHINEIIGLMQVNISSVEKGFLNFSEVEVVKLQAQSIDFQTRKYNQISHFLNLLKKLDDLVFVGEELYFEEDIQVPLLVKSKKRDGYLHRIYKNQLKEQSSEIFSEVKCMLEELAYPSLVASHIKPFIVSDTDEAYDANNGLLLSRNMDILFDQGYISFLDDGNIIYSKNLNNELKEHLSTYILNPVFLNDKRLEYLRYHKEHIFKESV
ncbi:MAG: putative restriction endonuclease [Sulfurimonas sp.]|jgi:putative restriction endonuclease|uniref:HNH endonuclease n=1 Tax=Sulfurimonas sp. TaxID=2022749 RepID=UPI0039E6FEDB